MRKLATHRVNPRPIGRGAVTNPSPIEGADRIEVTTIKGWKGICIEY